MNDQIINLLNNNIRRDTLKNLSLNDNHSKHILSVKHLINSDKKCYDFDKLNFNNNSVDALEYQNETFYFIEFKDERVYSFEHNWGKTMELLSKVFQSINEILKLYVNNQIPKIEFYNKKLKFIIVFSSHKSTDFIDFKTLQTILSEKYGTIFKIDILNEKMFLTDYVETNKIGII